MGSEKDHTHTDECRIQSHPGYACEAHTFPLTSVCISMERRKTIPASSVCLNRQISAVSLVSQPSAFGRPGAMNKASPGLVYMRRRRCRNQMHLIKLSIFYNDEKLWFFLKKKSEGGALGAETHLKISCVEDIIQWWKKDTLQSHGKYPFLLVSNMFLQWALSLTQKAGSPCNVVLQTGRSSSSVSTCMPAIAWISIAIQKLSCTCV